MALLLRKTAYCAVISLSLLSQGCSGNGAGLSGLDLLTKENIGAVTGAAGGAWIGSNIGGGKGNTVATAAGTLLGGILGANVGRSLDSADMQYYDRNSQYAMENSRSGETTTWNNPDSGVSGTITPTRTYESAGRFCRDYTQTINVDGRNVQGTGRACREDNGAWTIIQ